MKNIIFQILSDVDGQGSSKRVIAFAVLLVFMFMAVGSCFNLTIKDNIWDDVFYGLLYFGGLITAEKFTKRSIRTEGQPEIKP